MAPRRWYPLVFAVFGLKDEAQIADRKLPSGGQFRGSLKRQASVLGLFAL